MSWCFMAMAALVHVCQFMNFFFYEIHSSHKLTEVRVIIINFGLVATHLVFQILNIWSSNPAFLDTSAYQFIYLAQVDFNIRHSWFDIVVSAFPWLFSIETWVLLGAKSGTDNEERAPGGLRGRPKQIQSLSPWELAEGNPNDNSSSGDQKLRGSTSDLGSSSPSVFSERQERVYVESQAGALPLIKPANEILSSSFKDQEPNESGLGISS